MSEVIDQTTSEEAISDRPYVIRRQPSAVSHSPSAETGQLIRINIPTRDRSLWLGPAWSVICGLIASGSIVWQGQALLVSILAVLLADGFWATVWWTLIEIDWTDMLARWPEVEIGHTPHALPFTRSGSAADRLLNWLARSRAWLRSIVWPERGSAILSTLVAIGLAIIFSILIGWQALALSLAALALTQLALLTRKLSASIVSIIHGLLAVGLAWLLGHAAFNQITYLSLGMALLFSISYSGVIEVIRLEKSTRRWLLPQVLIVAILAVLQMPIAAFALIAVLVAQSLLSTVMHGSLFARSAQWWLMIAMLIAALAIRG